MEFWDATNDSNLNTFHQGTCHESIHPWIRSKLFVHPNPSRPVRWGTINPATTLLPVRGRVYLLLGVKWSQKAREKASEISLVLPTKWYYSLYSINATPLKRYTPHIVSYKIFSFCEQILKIGANDASGQGLQYAL